MGIKDLFSRGGSSDDGPADGTRGQGEAAQDTHDTGPGHADLPQGDEPGASTTQYDDGRGTVGLGDRIGGGAPDTNQAKAEPMPPTPGHADPAGTGPHTSPPVVPALEDMNVGATNAQIASPARLSGGTAGSGGPRSRAQGEVASRLAAGAVETGPAGAGTVPAEDRPAVGTSAATGLSSGPEMPESQTTGTAHRAPGLQGETPAGENVESDVQLGADRMVPADAPDRTGPPVEYPGDSQGVNVPSRVSAAGTSQEQGIAHGVKDPAT